MEYTITLQIRRRWSLLLIRAPVSILGGSVITIEYEIGRARQV